MVWFGSSAGVAVSNLFPGAKSATRWLRAAWWLPPAYVISFFVALGLLGWLHPAGARRSERKDAGGIERSRTRGRSFATIQQFLGSRPELRGRTSGFD